MGDVASGAHAPDPSSERTLPRPHPNESPGYEEQSASTVKEAAPQGAQAAGQVATEVTDAAKEQAQRVGDEAKTQARSVAADVRDRVSEQARTQNDKPRSYPAPRQPTISRAP